MALKDFSLRHTFENVADDVVLTMNYLTHQFGELVQWGGKKYGVQFVTDLGEAISERANQREVNAAERFYARQRLREEMKAAVTNTGNGAKASQEPSYFMPPQDDIPPALRKRIPF